MSDISNLEEIKELLLIHNPLNITVKEIIVFQQNNINTLPTAFSTNNSYNPESFKGINKSFFTKKPDDSFGKSCILLRNQIINIIKKRI